MLPSPAMSGVRWCGIVGSSWGRSGAWGGGACLFSRIRPAGWVRSRPSILHFPAGTDSRQRRSPGRVFSRLSHTDAQIDTLLVTKNLDFTIRMDRT